MKVLLTAFVSIIAATTPALAAPWGMDSDTSLPGEEVYLAFQDSAVPGSQLFFDCYAPTQSFSLGIFMNTPWIDTLAYPENVTVTFTIDGVDYEGRGFEFAPHGDMTVLQKFHVDDAQNFEQVFVPLLAAQRDIVVSYALDSASFSAEGIDPAFRFVLAGCGLK